MKIKIGKPAPVQPEPVQAVQARIAPSTVGNSVERVRTRKPPAPLASREVGKQMITILGGWTLHGLKRHAMSLLVCFGLTVAFVQIPVFAQTSEPATSAQTTGEPVAAASAEAQAQTQADTTVANEETKFTDDEIDQLISRIALYPDPSWS